MDYRIVLSPGLDIEIDEFVSAWNEAGECEKVAKAELSESPAESFAEPGTMAMFLGGVLASFAYDVLKDLLKEQVITFIKEKMPKKAKPEPEVEAITEVEIIMIDQSDGSRLFFIKDKSE